jgi:predicted nucleic-acid-binding Zn-ribbon protein
MEKNLLYAKMYRNKRKVNIMDDLKYWRSKDGSCPKCGCKERTETGSITSCGAFSEYDDLDKKQKTKHFVCNKCGHRYSAFK